MRKKDRFSLDYVAGIAETSHQEYSPEAQDPLIAPLSCSLVGKTDMVVSIARDSLAHRAYGRDSAMEQFRCN